MVGEAIEALPNDVRKYLKNAAIIVEDRPSRDQLEEMQDDPENTLLGLYQGVPETEWGKGFGNVLPDKISLFQENIEQIADTQEKIKNEIRLTVWHEIAHYFGFDDKEIEDLEKKIRIVILGGGFAGLNAVLELLRKSKNLPHFSITLVNEGDSFVFVPLLHEVATGTLSPFDVIQPIRHILPREKIKFFEGKAIKIDFENQTVIVRRCHEIEKGKQEITLNYDYLISALGSETNYFDIPGAKEFAQPLKTIEDAKRLRATIIHAFEKAEFANVAEQKKLLNFAIIGGGATGVEVAGELVDYTSTELRQTFPRLSVKPKITLVQAEKTLLSKEEPWFQAKARKVLCRKGNVDVLYSQKVIEVTANGIKTQDRFIEAKTVIWTAGVKAASIMIESGASLDIDEKKRIRVNEFLQLQTYPGVFIVGDQAHIADLETQQPYPMRAQFAAREGKLAARNILSLLMGKPLRPFKWGDKGFIVSLGKGGALARILGLHFSGPLAWFIYRTAYLCNLIGLRAKLRTAVRWAINLVLPRDIAKP